MPEDSLRAQLGELASSAEMIMKVPALKARMGSVDYYVITLPFGTAARYLAPTDPNLPAKQRENRRPTPARFREITNYIRRNPDDYRFSSLTCTYGRDGTRRPLEWEAAAPDGPGATIGMLTLDQRDPLIIVDGQHRFGAIRQAVEEDPLLRDEVISVVLFPYLSVQDAQQLFSDLNRTAKKTTKSLDILFDQRDVLNRIVQQIVPHVSVFGERVNLEDASVPTNSGQMFTLAGVYQATKPMIDAAQPASLLPKLAPTVEQEFVDYLVDAWEFIGLQFPEWGKVATGEMDIRDHRSEFLHWNSGVLSAIGEFVGDAMRHAGKGWKPLVERALSHPENYGWRRDLPQWQGIATAGKMVLPRSTLRPQVRAYLKCRAGMPLTDGDEAVLGNFSEEVRESLRHSATVQP